MFQILAQERGELLALQQLKHAHNQLRSQRDEEVSIQHIVANLEAFLICCHHASIFITSAVIDVDLLNAIGNGKLSESQFLCIKRSVKFDLAERQGVIDGSRAIIGLLRYLLAE